MQHCKKTDHGTHNIDDIENEDLKHDKNKKVMTRTVEEIVHNVLT